MKLRQIRVKVELYKKIKFYCMAYKITMFSFFYTTFEWFLHKELHKNKTAYIASCKNGHSMSLWLCDRHAEQIETFAKQAQVSDARVIYTALMRYLKHNNLFTEEL